MRSGHKFLAAGPRPLLFGGQPTQSNERATDKKTKQPLCNTATPSCAHGHALSLRWPQGCLASPPNPVAADCSRLCCCPAVQGTSLNNQQHTPIHETTTL